MKTALHRQLAIAALAFAGLGFLIPIAYAAPKVPAPAKATIVLVHGAFADGSGWAKVIPLLERDGYAVIAVQNPLTSAAEDIATTKRVIEAQTGPVIAVGHSYGGVVITAAAEGNPNVKAVVYIAAFAPDVGEQLGGLLEKYPSAIGHAFRPDAAGFLYLDRAQFRDVFAADLSVGETRVMAATQKPINGASFGATLDRAAWKSIPSWYLIASEDQAIAPALQRFFVERMRAHSAEVKSSHVPFLSQPKVVADFIKQAAASVSL